MHARTTGAAGASIARCERRPPPPRRPGTRTGPGPRRSSPRDERATPSAGQREDVAAVQSLERKGIVAGRHRKTPAPPIRERRHETEALEGPTGPRAADAPGQTHVPNGRTQASLQQISSVRQLALDLGVLI